MFIMSETVPKSKKKNSLAPLDVKINLLAYIIINVGLFFLNLIDTSYWWYVWVATGWGIGLLMYLSVRYITRGKGSSGLIGFKIHLSVYLIMSLYFIYLDTYTGHDFSNPITWAYYPISAWFSMLLAHFLSTLFIQIRMAPEEKENRKRFHLFNSFIIHMFVFLCANAYMLIINFLTGYEYKWHYWPLAATSLALSIHLFVTIIEILPMRNIQLKILLYHSFLFLVVSGYIIFDDMFSGAMHWWFWPVGGWFLGVLLHLIYYFIVHLARKKKK